MRWQSCQFVHPIKRKGRRKEAGVAQVEDNFLDCPHSLVASLSPDLVLWNEIHPLSFHKVWEDTEPWPRRSKLRSGSVDQKRRRYWALPDCLFRLPAARPQRLCRPQMCKRRRPHRITKSLSVRKNSLTSACRPSTYSTTRTPPNRCSAKKLPRVAAVATVAAAAAEAAAVADAAGEAAPGAAVVARGGVGRGAVVTPAERLRLAPAPIVPTLRAPVSGGRQGGGHGWALIGPAIVTIPVIQW